MRMQLKPQTDEKLNFDRKIYIVRGYSLRLKSKCYSHPIILIALKNYLRTFDVICVDFLRCANKECEFSNQNAKNSILNGFILH